MEGNRGASKGGGIYLLFHKKSLYFHYKREPRKAKRGDFSRNFLSEQFD